MDLEAGKKLLEKKQYKKALSFFLSKLERENKTIRLYLSLAFVYFQLNQIKDSIKYYKLALEIEPKSINIILNLANCNYVLGNFSLAKKFYLKSIILNKNDVRGYYGLYLIGSEYLDEDHILHLNQIKKFSKNLNQNYLIEFLLSKFAKKNKDFDRELLHLNNFQNQCFESNKEFNNQGLFYYNEIISKYYNKINFKNIHYSNEVLKKITPVFIIGLPRSGSTLIESIISVSNNQILSLGENSIINKAIFDQLKNYIYENNNKTKILDLTLDINDLTEKIAIRYQDYLINNNTFLIDKSLENFFNIETIINIFPNAKFINSRRNPKDSAIAIYQSMLPELPWAHSLSNILKYINDYIEIINFYEKKYSDKILSVDLESLTKNQVMYSKKIFEFCKLNWSPDILNFYKNKNLVVKTLSNTQLRDKITTYDNEKYKPYEKLIEKFKDQYNWLN